MNHILPPIQDAMPIPDHANPSATSAWVYNGEDKWSSGLYPMGFEVHPDSLESLRRPPARHSSFAAPRYARVVQRPQRAHSFVTRRDPFSLHGEGYSRLQPVAVPSLPNHKNINGHSLRRSSSLTMNGNVATLSRKYRAFSLGRPNDNPVIEVGSLVSTISEHSLAEALIDPGVFQAPLNVSKEDINFKEERKTYPIPPGINGNIPKLHKTTKGPAPLPPATKIETTQAKKEAEANKTLTVEETRNTPKHKSQEVRKLLPIIMRETPSEDESEDFCTCKSEYEEQIPIPSLTQENNAETECNKKDSSLVVEEPKAGKQEQRDCASLATQVESSDFLSGLEKTPNEISTPRISNQQEFLHALKVHLTTNRLSKPDEWEKLERLLTDILENNSEDIPANSESKFTTPLSKSQSHRSALRTPKISRSIYETFPNAISDAHFELLPKQEVQRNKIVLRVPSFKNTGCQTESYRPIRRRATLSQGPHTIVPRIIPNKNIWGNVIDIQMTNTAASSSSGYSSPEGESKGTSPIHSGPPSPGSTHTVEMDPNNGPNVTIIEVNRSESQPGFDNIFTHSKPSKPIRTRSFLEVSVAKRGLEISDKKQIPSLPAICENTMGVGGINNNIIVVTEAINPMLVHSKKETDEHIPRIVDVLHKRAEQEFNGSRMSRHEIYINNERTMQRPSNIRTNSLSLPRIHSVPSRSRLYRSESRTPPPTKELNMQTTLNGTASTAAYLASLELLASHYRQQALANAKQLQLQQHMLDQQMKQDRTSFAIPYKHSSHSSSNDPKQVISTSIKEEYRSD